MTHPLAGVVVLGTLVVVGALAATTASTHTPAGSTLLELGPATGMLFKSITHQGVEYKYVVHVPRDYDAAKKWPTIVFLHGAGECGTDGSKQVVQGLGAAVLMKPADWPFIVLLPQKPDVKKQWEDYDAPVMAMLDSAKQEYSVDASRIYLTGLSQGGHGTWTLAGNHPDVWAAIAPICGYVNFKRDGGVDRDAAAAIADKVKGLPIWTFHGEADDAVKPEQTRAVVDELTKLKADVKSSFYPGVNHNSWDKAYREEKLGAWFLSHTKK
ncbi:MAG: prolyl oligopeptidase family serine peptidase [Planctomycetota bacterium]